VITFHSLEDRIVKNFGREASRDYLAGDEMDSPGLRKPTQPKIKIVNRKAIQPTQKEIDQNPRSRSAQLRIFEKI
jgi:16S rRNA (cytosine1402-N4)-methyltransferase